MEPACGEAAAVSHAECPICFEDLCMAPVSVFVNPDRKRACRHFFHYGCIKEVTDFSVAKGNHLACPMCRADFMWIIEMPDPTIDAERWFSLVDADDSGSLSIDEVRDVVLATCNVNEDDVERVIKERWDNWDKDGTKGIEWNEFPPLLTFIRENLPERSRQRTPDITAGREEGKGKWFSFWDTDGNGVLELDEVARALIKTFDQDGVKRVQEMQAIVACVWPLFDPDSSRTITKDEFLTPDGLADTIVASLKMRKKMANSAL